MLAVSAYREFLTLYPQHPRSDYAQFRAGESYFKQKNSSDRDQTATKQALEEYERLLDLYPQSTHVEETRDRIKTCRQTLARAHHQVGFFYQKTRKSWRAADRAVRDDPDGLPGLREARRGAVPHQPVPVLRRPLRRGPAATSPRLRSEFPKSPFVPEADKLEQTFPAVRPGCGPRGGRPSDSPAAPPAEPACHTAAHRPLTSSVTLRM